MTIQQLMDRKDSTDSQDFFCEMLDLNHLRDRPIKKLSGGELQRMAIALVCVGQADVFMFDEPSSYLDVKQRLNAARRGSKSRYKIKTNYLI